MKTIKINEKEYTLPQSWNDCTLKQAIKVSEYEAIEDDYKVLALIAGYTDIPMEDLSHMRITEIKDIVNNMTFILEPMPETPIVDFEFKGETYHVIQSFLDEQAQDYFTTEAILGAYQHNTFKALPELLAVMCKKDGEHLDDYNLKDRAKLFEDLPMDIANGIRLFFWSVGILSQQHFQSFSQANQIIVQKANEVENIVKELDGMGWRGRWLAKILRKFVKSSLQIWQTFSSGQVSTIKK
jgi:hypothetical protein